MGMFVRLARDGENGRGSSGWRFGWNEVELDVPVFSFGMDARCGDGTDESWKAPTLSTLRDSLRASASLASLARPPVLASSGRVESAAPFQVHPDA
jgi:hypothetical protein